MAVHGTWVSEKKIEPCFPVELTEGDTLKIGGSTRVYRLHWIPLSQAYDMDNPFVWPLVVPVAEEKEEENQAEKHQVRVYGLLLKKMNSLPLFFVQFKLP